MLTHKGVDGHEMEENVEYKVKKVKLFHYIRLCFRSNDSFIAKTIYL